ncbi:hypothetical protein OSG_eHP31_00180 [environmental Halophage eHP-31]|nr:hypothetical protein OSG_eHP31_00180 [environmental Halophage eHP-31]
MIHIAIFEFVTNHPEQVAGLLAGLVAAAVHTVKTGTLPLGRLPWRAIRHVIRDLREQYFGKPRPRGVPGLIVDVEPAALEGPLRERYFEGAPASYDYSGEDLNLRRPASEHPHPDDARQIAMELHVRAFKTADGGSLVLTQFEPSRYEEPGPHLRLPSRWRDGRELIEPAFEDAGLSVQRVESEQGAGVDVV